MVVKLSSDGVLVRTPFDSREDYAAFAKVAERLDMMYGMDVVTGRLVVAYFPKRLPETLLGMAREQSYSSSQAVKKVLKWLRERGFDGSEPAEAGMLDPVEVEAREAYIDAVEATGEYWKLSDEWRPRATWPPTWWYYERPGRRCFIWC